MGQPAAKDLPHGTLLCGHESWFRLAHRLPSSSSCSFHASVGGGRMSVSADSCGINAVRPCPNATACVTGHTAHRHAAKPQMLRSLSLWASKHTLHGKASRPASVGVVEADQTGAC